jgi:hypothetical protein
MKILAATFSGHKKFGGGGDLGKVLEGWEVRGQEKFLLYEGDIYGLKAVR